MSAPKMRAALRHLCEHGELALKQQKFGGDRWRKAMVSKRVAADLRKQAMREGTYGTFNAETGVGWDYTWDNPGRVPSLKPPKESKSQHTREKRATKIETKLVDMEKQIAEHREKLRDRKPEPSFENYYKRLMRSKGK
mmetsp:Transcript_16456/g.27314  ORF Transcript_16456/g.27314 Transcript_16456/m.27314 type:complete len:138 (-) Transcript_16456:214-627(-)|eukprot:CAMPEP_0119003268 /NCGR_PEP_ID=MMETSP1176-20130426/464_1 /TAXON_ID=265551 /ORGANISM="Synedropsis recta cf, Strain CCMP1620" /LENGTH=137 /DNA_ID=CAMNT_0006954851 /DNA_START=71 /DNA_END=484 /DNA_ORIENTATION=+